MTERPQECPNCESWETERVHIEWYTYEVETVRICHNCPTQYTLNYADPQVIQQEQVK